MPGIKRLGHTGTELSREGKQRLQWIEWYRDHGENARLTCRHFSLSPDTLYRWLRRYNPRDLTSLETGGKRPKRVRRPTWTAPQVQAVLKIREQHPRWGKEKLGRLLAMNGCRLSVSMVGRILADLKKRGVLREPLAQRMAGQRANRQRVYARRKPKEYQAKAPGDLVEVDTLDIRPIPGEIFKQFTARDVVSRWDVLGLYRQATAFNAARFLDQVLERMPFPVRAIQVDGGSEFHEAFEGSLPAQGPAPVRVAPARTQAQWACGASEPHAYGRVLRALRRGTGVAHNGGGAAGA